MCLVSASRQPCRACSCIVVTRKRPSGENNAPRCEPFQASGTGSALPIGATPGVGGNAAQPSNSAAQPAVAPVTNAVAQTVEKTTAPVTEAGSKDVRAATAPASSAIVQSAGKVATPVLDATTQTVRKTAAPALRFNYNALRQRRYAVPKGNPLKRGVCVQVRTMTPPHSSLRRAGSSNSGISIMGRGVSLKVAQTWP